MLGVCDKSVCRLILRGLIRPSRALRHILRRESIHVSSGTYCSAPAQFERRIMSQMPFTAPLSDCWVAWRLPLDGLADLGMESVSVIGQAADGVDAAAQRFNRTGSSSTSRMLCAQ